MISLMDSLTYFDFCQALQNILRSGEVFVDGQTKLAVHSGSTLNNLRVLRELIRDRKPARTLEIGLAFGVSALTILSSLQEFCPAGYYHTGIDPFQKDQWHNAALLLIEQTGLSAHFRFTETFSSLALPGLLAQGELFDLIYVDGSHRYEHVFVDYFFCLRLLRKGGVVLFDDCTTDDVGAVVKFAAKHHRHVCKPFNLSSYDAPNKTFKKRVANLLGIRQLKGFCKVGEDNQFMF